jgi:hypothetical protein
VRAASTGIAWPVSSTAWIASKGNCRTIGATRGSQATSTASRNESPRWIAEIAAGDQRHALETEQPAVGRPFGPVAFAITARHDASVPGCPLKL